MKARLLLISLAVLSAYYSKAQETRPAMPSKKKIIVNGKLINVDEKKTTPASKNQFETRQIELNGKKMNYIVMSESGVTGSGNPTNLSKNEPVNGNNTNGTSSLKIIRGGGSSAKRGGEATTKVKNRICFNREMQTNKLSDRFGLMTAKSANVYPGAILTGKNLLNGNYEVIKKPANPIRIGIIDVANVDIEKLQKTVSNPTMLDLTLGAVSLINNLDSGIVQADGGYISSEILSTADIKLNCDIHADGFFGFEVSNIFQYQKHKMSTTYMASFIQRYFTIAAMMPISDSIFKDGTKPDDEMFYVSSVTYGRRGILFITVDSTNTTIIDSLDLHHGGITQSFNLSADFLKSDAFKKVRIEGYVYGGDATSAFKIFDMDPAKTMKEFFSVLNNGSTFSKTNYGSPIEYTLSFLKTNEPASIEFDVKETKVMCEEGTPVQITLKSITAKKVDDGKNDKTGEFYGIIQVNYHTPNSPVTIPEGINRFTDKEPGNWGGNDMTYRFDTKRGNSKNSIINLPLGGRQEIFSQNIGYRLHTNVRPSHLSMKEGTKKVFTDKAAVFLVPDDNMTHNFTLFANFDERDDDDADENMEGLTDEEVIRVKMAQVPKIGQPPILIKQQLRDTDPEGTLLEIQYEVKSIRPEDF